MQQQTMKEQKKNSELPQATEPKIHLMFKFQHFLSAFQQLSDVETTTNQQHAAEITDKKYVQEICLFLPGQRLIGKEHCQSNIN